MSNRQTTAVIETVGPHVASVAVRHIDHAFRCILHGPHVVAEPRRLVMITREPHPFGNVAILAHDADTQDAAHVGSALAGCGAPSVIVLTSAVTVAVEDELRRNGFAPHGAMPAMAVESDALAPTALPAGCELVRVGVDESEAWADAFARGYEIPLGLARLFAPESTGVALAEDAPVQYFAIRRAGRIVSTSTLFLAEGVAGVYCVSTVPEARGAGLGAFVTAEPLRLVRALGYRVGVLQSSEAGHSVYRKLGFTDLGEAPLFLRMGG